MALCLCLSCTLEILTLRVELAEVRSLCKHVGGGVMCKTNGTLLL